MDNVSLGTDVIEDLLDQPCWVVDFLPRQVPANSAGCFSAVEQHYLSYPHAEEVFRSFAQVILRLYCYYDLFVGRGYSPEFEHNPSPALLEAEVAGCADGCRANRHLNIVLSGAQGQRALVVVDGDALNLSVYGADDDLLALLGPLASSQGLFLWKSPAQGLPQAR